MTIAEEAIYKEGFEAAFKLLSEYIENGVDMATARVNAEKIMSVRKDRISNRFLTSNKAKASKKS
jgi:hypothetical protein|tara:strand:- start:43 stop:237 length:195 start_codon:yes stop_codon:yes gene_type:complete